MSDKYKKNPLLDEHLVDIPDERSILDKYLWIRGVALLVLCTLIGWISVLFRPYFQNGVHIETIVSLVMVATINLGLLVYIIRQKRKQYKLAYLIGTTAIWLGYTIGWALGLGHLWEDVLVMNTIGALAGLGIGQFVFYYRE